MNVLLMLAHSIAEYDDLRMFHDMGLNVFSIGAYTNPAEPGDNKRPALPQVPYHPELAKLVEGDQLAHKAYLPQGLIDWADAIVIHHFLDEGPAGYPGWLVNQWGRIAHKRVIWRTCGQSDPRLETLMARYRRQGLQIVRYSPKEEEAFTRWHCFAGSDALIRFGKYPEDWGPWVGHWEAVGNVTQNFRGRGASVGYPFWRAATEGLPTSPIGPGPDAAPGAIELSYDELREYLCLIRAYLYTGTEPAPYTLGLIEAMMSGTPVVSIGPESFGYYGQFADLFEAPKFLSPELWHNDPGEARIALQALLEDRGMAWEVSHRMRHCAEDLFDVRKVSRQWAEFLGAGVAVREAVAA